jgi:hypothetical protein
MLGKPGASMYGSQTRLSRRRGASYAAAFTRLDYS